MSILLPRTKVPHLAIFVVLLYENYKNNYDTRYFYILLFLTNAAYIQNFDKTPTAKSANPDLIIQCIEEKKRHNSVGVKIVQYHKSPLLIETHDRATAAMAKTRKEFHQKNK